MSPESLFASISIRLGLRESLRVLVKVPHETATVYFESIAAFEAWKEGVK